MPKQYTFDQTLRNRTAVDGDKRKRKPITHRMDGACCQLLSYAGFTFNQDCCGGRRQGFDGGEYRLHGSGSCNQNGALEIAGWGIGFSLPPQCMKPFIHPGFEVILSIRIRHLAARTMIFEPFNRFCRLRIEMNSDSTSAIPKRNPLSELDFRIPEISGSYSTEHTGGHPTQARRMSNPIPKRATATGHFNTRIRS